MIALRWMILPLIIGAATVTAACQGPEAVDEPVEEEVIEEPMDGEVEETEEMEEVEEE